MNAPKHIEIALATLIRDYAGLPPGVTIRAWQTLEADATWSEAEDRTFPMIEVRCSPPIVDENQHTLQSQAAILIGTQTADDKDHADISHIYGLVQETIDRFFSQRPGRSPGAEFNTFTSVMENAVGPASFLFNGLTFGEPITPYEDRGAALIGLTLVIHYTRSDFN